MEIRKNNVLVFLLLAAFSSLTGQQLLNETLVFDGETRDYTLYIPANYDGSEAMPLLFNFHGGGDNIASQIAISNMQPIADTAGFLIVYPQALADPNDGDSANWLHKEPTSVDDIFFVEAMIETISSEYEINENRIYVCGYSLGGEFTYELACRLNDRIAAVGVVARTMGTIQLNSCNPEHPTGILTILGTDDFISPYEGLVWNGIEYYIAADEVHSYWANANNTTSIPMVTSLPNLSTSDGSTVERHRWTEGDACVTVEHLKVLGGGHDWPGSFGNMDIDASLEIWNFVAQYDLTGLIDCATTSILEEGERGKKNGLYPNPVIDYLTIDFDFTMHQAYHIYSTKGECVLSGQLESAPSIDLSAIPAGLYCLRVGEEVLKFVKAK